jgi:hypothetical protein
MRACSSSKPQLLRTSTFTRDLNGVLARLNAYPIEFGVNRTVVSGYERQSTAASIDATAGDVLGYSGRRTRRSWRYARVISYLLLTKRYQRRGYTPFQSDNRDGKRHVPELCRTATVIEFNPAAKQDDSRG